MADQNLSPNPKCNKNNIKTAYEKIDVQDLIGKKVMDEKSCLNKETIQMLIICGKTKKQFNELNMNMVVVAEEDIEFSASRMKDKKQST